MRKLPVTIVTGFLGAGKTSLLRHLLSRAEGQRIALLINEFSELGIDRELLLGCDPCGGNDVIELVLYEPVADRIEFVADLARNWTRLRSTPPAERRVVVVLANYPSRDGRIGNGVGLDTPAAAIAVLHALAAAGYRVRDIPESGDALVARLLRGPTNADPSRPAEETFPHSDYAAFFATMPRAAQDKVNARWGAPERDLFFREGELDCGMFAFPALRCGAVTIAVQPSHGYNIDPQASYHDPALPPPHSYLAFHAWIADGLRAHAVVHLGKHGNLEWLSGKAVALSADCYAERMAKRNAALDALGAHLEGTLDVPRLLEIARGR